MSAAVGSVQEDVLRVVRQTRAAARMIAQASTQQKNAVLQAMARELGANRDRILAANAKDVELARGAGLAGAMVDRLTLNEPRVEEMVRSVEAVVALPDPVGQVIRTWSQPNGMRLSKVRVPLGVIGIIYESRPNVTTECGSLCLKSGNAVVLRGGSESFHSNAAIAEALKQALNVSGLPPAAISTLPTADRSAVDALLQLDEWIDVIIPRGGEALIRKIMDTSRIPVIKHAKGVCHVYVDDAADPAMAEAIVLNAKCQRPSTCNAMETLLVHERIAATFIPRIVKALRAQRVEVRGDERTRQLASEVRPVTEEDWAAEYLDLILAVRVVPSLEAAMEHIARYGSAHSDAIVTGDAAHAERFAREVDSAAVFVNASTRLSDGFQFGFGAEIGISTDRLHARGPMGLEELTTYKYVIRGDGQLRQ